MVAELLPPVALLAGPDLAPFAHRQRFRSRKSSFPIYRLRSSRRRSRPASDCPAWAPGQERFHEHAASCRPDGGLSPGVMRWGRRKVFAAVADFAGGTAHGRGPPTAADSRENGRRHRPVRSSRTRRTGMPITVSIRMSRTRAFSRLWVPAPHLAIDRARGRRRRRPGRRATRRIISRRRASRCISRACSNRSARTTPMPEA